MVAVPVTLPSPTSRAARLLVTLVTWLAMALLALGGILVASDVGSFNGNTSLADRTTARLAAEGLLPHLKDAEAGQRHYLLTGAPSHLTPYETARRQLDQDFADLRAAPSPSPSQVAQIARIRRLTEAKLADLARAIELFQSGEHDGARQLGLANQATRTMDVIGTEVADLRNQLMQTQGKTHSTYTLGAAIVLLALAAVSFAASIWAKRRIQRDIDAKLHRLERFTQAFGQTQGTLRSLDGRIVFWGIGAERLYGYSEKEALGKNALELLHTRCPVSLEEINATLVRDGEWQGELTRRHKDGREIHIISKWSLNRGEAGEPEVAIEVSSDITSIKLAERELHQTNALLRAILETAPGLIYAKDLQGRIILANVSTLDLIGRPWSEVENRTDLEFLDNKTQAELVMANDRRIMDQAKTEEFEEVISREGRHPRVWSSTKAPLRDADGKVIGLVGVSVEITERKRIEERLQLMVNELNHRVKNTLATVQAIASQTLRGGDPIVRQNLERRLMALAAAHDVLTREKWEGANIDDVVAGALAPFGDGGDYRFRVSGPSLRLLPRAALALAMGLHELTTNALKYGALSTLAGQVAIHWQIVDGASPMLRLTWTESGGPLVIAPSKRGFGVRLIERSLAQDLGGKASVIFDQPSGIVGTIEAPLADVVVSAEVTPLLQVGAR